MGYHEPKGKLQKDFTRLVEESVGLKVEEIFWNNPLWFVRLEGIDGARAVNYWGGIEKVMLDFKFDCANGTKRSRKTMKNPVLIDLTRALESMGNPLMVRNLVKIDG